MVMMFWQAFWITVGIIAGLASAATVLVTVAALFYWLYKNIEEYFAPKKQEVQTTREDNWPYDGPIGGRDE